MLRYGVQIGRLFALKFFVIETQSSLPLGLIVVEFSGWGSGGTKLCEFLRQDGVKPCSSNIVKL